MIHTWEKLCLMRVVARSLAKRRDPHFAICRNMITIRHLYCLPNGCSNNQGINVLFHATMEIASEVKARHLLIKTHRRNNISTILRHCYLEFENSALYRYVILSRFLILSFGATIASKCTFVRRCSS